MPTVQDEEESLCLLASDLQESTTPALKNSQSHSVGDKHWGQCSSNQSDCNEDWADCDDENQSSFLSQGTAEKAFFNVCKTNDEEEEEDEEDNCVEVMNDIIGALEADHEAAVNAASAAAAVAALAAAAGKTASEIETETRNSRSLVVDIHLPPATEDDEDMEDEAASNLGLQHGLQEHHIQPPVAVTTTSRPCKHEVNRFQRCYSDGSQASPKKKAKASNWFYLL